VSGTAALATAVGLLAAAPHATARPQPPARPPEVTAGQVAAANSAKQAVAQQVGVLSAQIADAKIRVQQAEGRAELAEQRYALAVSQRQAASAAAAKAQATLRSARTNVVKAHQKFVDYVRASYMSGDLGGTAGTLLTATDPSSLLEQTALEQYQQQHKADAIGGLETASVIKSNAEAAARRTLEARKKAEAREQQRRREAQAAYVAAQQQKAALESDMVVKQRQLDAAQSQLIRLSSGRAAWLKYQKAYNEYTAALARWEAEQRRKAEERRRRLAQQHHSSGGGGGGGSSSWHPGPSAPSGGTWTAAKGERAAHRALSQLGMPYAWAGGGAYGPSQGVCDPSNGAPNDCNVSGFDCSGLTMYAWGAGGWAHYAATQYIQAGSFHPSAGQLQPGDLIFWSSNGTVWGIHHVAIYIGNQRIVEAPYSGGYVQTASLWEYGGFFGATRPLT
jgi:cell wall-associated NlpC family hydrolase